MKDNFMERMNARLAENGVKGRQDLQLHDSKVIEQGRAVKIVASYSQLYGPPSIWDVQNWVTEKMGPFGNAIVARQDTIAVYPEKNFLTMIVEQRLNRRPLTDAKKMTKAGVDQYLDAESTLWEVIHADGAPAYIVRREGAPIERMMEARKQALKGGANGRKHVALASIDALPTKKGFAGVDLGDMVDFYHGGLIHRGTVSTANEAGIKIKVGSDVYTVDPQAVTMIVEKSAASEKQEDDLMRRYFSHVYPGNPEMVEKISPLSTKSVDDTRNPDITPIQQTLQGSTAKGTPPGPTQRVLGAHPGTRAVATPIVSGSARVK